MTASESINDTQDAIICIAMQLINSSLGLAKAAVWIVLNVAEWRPLLNTISIEHMCGRGVAYCIALGKRVTGVREVGDVGRIEECCV